MSLQAKKGRSATHNMWYQPIHSPLCWNPIHLAHIRRQGPWIIPSMDSEPGKARWLARGKPEDMSPISDLNYHKGRTLPEPIHMNLSTWAVFPPDKHLTCFTTLCLHWNSFIHSRQARALSPAIGLGLSSSGFPCFLQFKSEFGNKEFMQSTSCEMPG